MEPNGMYSFEYVFLLFNMVVFIMALMSSSTSSSSGYSYFFYGCPSECSYGSREAKFLKDIFIYLGFLLLETVY